jgi:hypothetical protein
MGAYDVFHRDLVGDWGRSSQPTSRARPWLTARTVPCGGAHQPAILAPPPPLGPGGRASNPSQPRLQRLVEKDRMVCGTLPAALVSTTCLGDYRPDHPAELTSGFAQSSHPTDRRRPKPDCRESLSRTEELVMVLNRDGRRCAARALHSPISLGRAPSPGGVGCAIVFDGTHTAGAGAWANAPCAEKMV